MKENKSALVYVGFKFKPELLGIFKKCSQDRCISLTKLLIQAGLEFVREDKGLSDIEKIYIDTTLSNSRIRMYEYIRDSEVKKAFFWRNVKQHISQDIENIKSNPEAISATINALGMDYLQAKQYGQKGLMKELKSQISNFKQLKKLMAGKQRRLKHEQRSDNIKPKSD